MCIASIIEELSVLQQKELEKLLTEFNDVFLDQLPAGLPPKRVVDHHIDLFPGAHPMSTSPCRMD